MEDQLIQYYIVNQDLNMSAGKIAAQVAHVAVRIALVESSADDMLTIKNKFWDWYSNFDKKKIILRGHQKDLEKLKDGFYSIYDLGLTEIEPNSLTCVGLGTMWKSEAQKYIKGLQLL